MLENEKQFNKSGLESEIPERERERERVKKRK